MYLLINIIYIYIILRQFLNWAYYNYSNPGDIDIVSSKILLYLW